MSEIEELRKRLDKLENKEEVDEIKVGEDFDGVFRFTNNSDEDFTALWNNKEYTFPAGTRSPMIILGESPENVQAIRKKWAYKWAEREWYKGDQYRKMKEMGNGLPPVRQDKDLEPLIQMCLDPLPISRAIIREGKPENINISEHTAAVEEDANLNETFKEVTKVEKIKKLGKQPTTFNA